MTGRYPARFGYEHNPTGYRNHLDGLGLPLAERTIAELLQNSGYATGLVGKWHLGANPEFHPRHQGFDEFFGFLHEGHFFVPPPWKGVTTMLRRRALPDGGKGRWTSRDGRLILSTHMGNSEPKYDANNPILRESQPHAETAYLTDVWTRESIDFIERHQERPFFLYIAHNAVHSPLQGADKYMKRFEHIEDVHRRIFAAMLANLDDSVGDVLAKIRDSDLDEHTLVFFLSDNGGPTRELTSSNKPLRGGKGDMYEGGIRVPFLARWSGKIPAGKTYDKPVSSLDIFGTAAAAAGLSVPKNRPIDGVDLLPYLTGANTGRPHETLFWRQGRRTAIRVGDWKLVLNPRGRSEVEWQLYDLAKDPSESKNLLVENPEQARELLGKWNKLNSEMAEPATLKR